MKTIASGLQAHYETETTTIATCWKATLKDGTILGFTSHVEDLSISGVTYEAASGYTPTNVETSADLSVDNLEVQGFLDSPSITDEDLLAGRWDHAQIEIFEVNYENTSQGTNTLRVGWLGEVSLGRSNFKAELRGLAQRYQQVIIEVTTPSCRATLGDERCTVDLTDYTTTGEVTGVTSNREFDTDLTSSTVRLTPSSTGAPDQDYFGKIEWLTGLNAGLEMEVKNYGTGSPIDGSLSLQLAMPYEVQVGDTFSAVARCNKDILLHCKARFGNVLNFRGEPYKPTPTQILRGPISS